LAGGLRKSEKQDWWISLLQRAQCGIWPSCAATLLCLVAIVTTYTFELSKEQDKRWIWVKTLIQEMLYVMYGKLLRSSLHEQSHLCSLFSGVLFVAVSYTVWEKQDGVSLIMTFFSLF